MITYKQACEHVGYNRTKQCPVELIYKFYAYKNGLCELFDTKEEALKFSKNIEKISTNKSEYDAWYETQRKLEAQAHDFWYDSLKLEYSNLDAKLFNLVYSEACGRGHSAGCDEVANYFDEILDFAMKIKEL